MSGLTYQRESGMRTNDIRHASELLRRGFSWADTEEGSNYWTEVYHKLCRLSGCHVEDRVVYVWKVEDRMHLIADPDDPTYPRNTVFEIRKYNNEM